MGSEGQQGSHKEEGTGPPVPQSGWVVGLVAREDLQAASCQGEGHQGVAAPGLAWEAKGVMANRARRKETSTPDNRF